MQGPIPKQKMTAAEYLSWEADQVERHEFVDGYIVDLPATSGAPAGARHITVVMNIGFQLRTHLKGTACRAYVSAMLLHVVSQQRYFFPDVMVTCSAADHSEDLKKSEPSLVIEVLSKSTANYDRGEKFVSYRHIPSLREYVMVDIDSRQIEAYRLGEQGLWVLHPFDLRVVGATLSLTSVDLTLTSEQVFADLD